MRQNTPHPKELKAKAHKLFSKGGQNSSLEESDLQQQQHSKLEQEHPDKLAPVIAEAVNRNVRESMVDSSSSPAQTVNSEQTEGIGNGQGETSEDDDLDFVSLGFLWFEG